MSNEHEHSPPEHEHASEAAGTPSRPAGVEDASALALSDALRSSFNIV